MAIRVNQDDPQSAASVVITGNEMDDIVALKADMTQNLFQAIAKLDANGPKGPMKGSPPSKGMDQMWGGGGGKGMSGGGKSSSSYYGGGHKGGYRRAHRSDFVLCFPRLQRSEPRHSW